MGNISLQEMRKEARKMAIQELKQKLTDNEDYERLKKLNELEKEDGYN